MDQHALKVLEFGRLLEVVAGHACGQAGAAWVRGLLPETRLRAISRQHPLYRDVRGLLEQGVSLPGLTFADPAPQFARARPADAVLAGDDLLVCRDFIRVLIRLAEFAVGEACADCRHLREHAGHVSPPRTLLDKLDKALDDDGQLVDRASPRLAELRRQARTLESRNRRLLENLLRDDAQADLFQERFVTLRNGRYVVPIRREARNRFQGVVHDLSDSGHTVFMEPAESVAIGNELAATRLEERDECRRIFAALSALLRNELPALLDALQAVALLDGVFAIARWAVAAGCVMPLFSGRIVLRNARHPLLESQFRREGRLKELVPLNLALPENTRALVVTGSNSGGKTVTLKTLGLLTLAAQAGLPVPADEGTELELFEKVFADIGDEQSLTDNLSTFTGHLARMKEIFAGLSGGRALVLLDELGTGTDPLEGGAIGCALLAEFAERGAMTVATTHLGAVKSFADDQEGMLNAAVRFNIETLEPEYVVDIGRPGASHALRIAQRIGVPEAVLKRARQRMDSDHLRLENILADLDEQRRLMTEEERATRESLDAARRDRAQLHSQIEALRGERKKILHDAYEQAERIVLETRRRMEGLLAGLNSRAAQTQAAPPEERQAARAEIDAQARRMAEGKVRTGHRPTRPVAPEELEKGMVVWVQSLAEKATVQAFSRGGKKVVVRLEDMDFTVRLADLERPEKNAPETAAEAPPGKRKAVPSPAAGGGISKPRLTGAVGSEINLLGKRVDEACGELDRFLDRARMGNLHEIRIVHGFGTGRLMKGVHDYLDQSGYRGRYRLADAARKEPGGGGVTIVELA